MDNETLEFLLSKHVLNQPRSRSGEFFRVSD